MEQTKNLSSADATAIIDQALLDAQNGGTPATPDVDPLLLTSPAEPPDEDEPETSEDDQKIEKAKDDLLGKEAADALRKEEAERQAREATLIGAAQRLIDKSKAASGRASERIATFPTPGSIMLPLVLLALFFFILITFNGRTRLHWIWLVLTNNAHVTPGASNTAGSGPSAIPARSPDIPTIDVPAFKPNSNGMYGSPF